MPDQQGPDVRLTALREAIETSPVLSSYSGLVAALNACTNDRDLHDGVFGFTHTHLLRERSRRTIDLAREAEVRDMPYQLTFLVDASTSNPLARVDVRMVPVYPSMPAAS